MPVGMWNASDFQGRWEGWRSCRGICGLSTGRQFPQALSPNDSQLPPQRDTQCAVKPVPEAVQETYRQRSIQNFEITFIQSPDPITRKRKSR